MTKPPEEGKIWEWRGFGRISPSVRTLVESLPIRNGVRDHQGTDIYLIPPTSEQNVKVRLTDKGWVLKFKVLLEKRPDRIELYRETASWTYAFPLAQESLDEAANLLAVALPEADREDQHYSEDQFIAAFSAATPPVVAVKVSKVRSQFQFEGGWLEIADVDFGARQVQSLSLHSAQIETVERMIDRVHPDSGLTVMNYVEACRRLASTTSTKVR